MRKKRRRKHKDMWRKRGFLQKMRLKSAYPLIKMGGFLIAGATIVVLFVFVGLPLIQGTFSKEASSNLKPNEFLNPSDVTPGQTEEAGKFQKEALIGKNFSSVNDPFISGEEIIFSSASLADGVSIFDKLVIYNTRTTLCEMIGINVKYDNIILTKINKDFIVWIDSHIQGGGRICGYDRKKDEQFLIKEFAFAAPQISLDGNMMVFMQQAGQQTDKLYAYDLSTRESAAIEVLTDTILTSADIDNGRVIYAIGSLELYRSTIYIRPLDGSPATTYAPGKLITNPKLSGNIIAYLVSSGYANDLFVMRDGRTPELVCEDVLNFDLGDDFIAYTKGDNLFAAPFETLRPTQINSKMSRAMLASANGNQLCWYDVTGGFNDIDILKYAEVEF